MVEVMGATVTADKYAIELCRVEHDHGSLLVRARELIEADFSACYRPGHAATRSQVRRLGRGIRMLLVAPAVAGLRSRVWRRSVLTKRSADQRRTVHPRPLGGSIRGAEQC